MFVQPVSHLNVDFQTLSVVEAVFPAEDSLDDLDEEIKMIVARGQTKTASHDRDSEAKVAGKTVIFNNRKQILQKGFPAFLRSLKQNKKCHVS